MAPEGPGNHTQGEKERARRKSASGANLMIELEQLKRKQSASVYEEEEEFISQFLEDVIIGSDQNVPAPSINVDELNFSLLNYLGKVTISEQSLEVSGDLWESEEDIPSDLASLVSHKSFQLNDENPKGKFFSIVPMGEEDPQTCFAEQGEETPTKSECFCQANLAAYAEEIETQESATESDENELTPEYIASNETSISDKQKHTVSFIEMAAPKQEVKSESFCDQFDPVNVIADKFVGWILKSAVTAICWNNRQKEESEIQIKETICSVTTFVESYNFSWPMIGDFTPQVGNNAIQEYIVSWYYNENWIYEIKLVLKQSDESSDYFTYETKWGIATKQYPIPQVTASIFFVIEVSRVKPVNCLVDITYYYEGSSYMQAPVTNYFNEQLLFDIVYAKLKFYKQLRF